MSDKKYLICADAMYFMIIPSPCDTRGSFPFEFGLRRDKRKLLALCRRLMMHTEEWFQFKPFSVKKIRQRFKSPSDFMQKKTDL